MLVLHSEQRSIRRISSKQINTDNIGANKSKLKYHRNKSLEGKEMEEILSSISLWL